MRAWGGSCHGRLPALRSPPRAWWACPLLRERGPKLWLIASSSSVGLVWAAVLVGLAAILTFAHLGPMAANALSGRAPPDAFIRPDGASFLLVAPVALGAVATLSLLVFASALSEFLKPVWTPMP